MDPIIGKLLEYSLLSGALAFIAWQLWQKLGTLERAREKESKAPAEKLEKDGTRCEKALDSAIGRIRLLEDARVNDMREDKQALVRVLDRTASALETNAVAFKTLVDERREGSGAHPTRKG